jgi:hypothetical protein
MSAAASPSAAPSRWQQSALASTRSSSPIPCCREICGHCLVYPAFAIASFGPPKPGEVDARVPISFWRAAIRQWVNNVKGRVMVIGTIAAYAAIARCPLNVAVQSVLCLPQAAVSTSLSTLFGSAARGRS